MAASYRAALQPQWSGCRLAAAATGHGKHRCTLLTFSEAGSGSGGGGSDRGSGSGSRTGGGGTATETKPSAPPVPRLASQPRRIPPNGPVKGGDGPSGGPRGPSPTQPPRLPPDVAYFLTLLIEYGGLIGTAAVVVGLLTHTDPWGSMHWDQQDALTGLALVTPLMILDAAMLLPDYSPQSKDDVMRLFVDPAKLQQAADAAKAAAAATAALTTSRSAPAGATSSESESERGARTGREGEPGAGSSSGGERNIISATVTNLVTAAASTEGAAGRAAGSAGSEGGGASTSGQAPAAAAAASTASMPPLSGMPAWLLRMQVAMHLYQERAIMENPGARLSIPREALVILVATLTDEMLYRAVMLTLVGRWLTDRLYEAGMDDMMWGGVWPLGPEGLPTSDAGKWLAVGLSVAFGVTAFAVRAANSMKNVQVHEAGKPSPAEDAAEKPPAPRKALPGWEKPPAPSAGRKSTTGAEATGVAAAKGKKKLLDKELTQQLARSVGLQSAFATAVEGFREITQVATAGVAFTLTGNLLAPVAGSLVVHSLFATWQRVGLQRVIKKRHAIVEEMLQKMSLRRKEQRARASASAAAAAAASTAASNADAPTAPPTPPGVSSESPLEGAGTPSSEEGAAAASTASSSAGDSAVPPASGVQGTDVVAPRLQSPGEVQPKD